MTVTVYGDVYFLINFLFDTLLLYITAKITNTPFSYGVACYPEKHEEAPNMESDLYWAKQKVDNGAEYLVTQMFFDNNLLYLEYSTGAWEKYKVIIK